jgi:hypothetical protein
VEPRRLVSGGGFTYRTPASWAVEVAPRSAVARRDGATLVSVTVLPLVHAYRVTLFPRVVVELDRVAATLAKRLHGAVTSRKTVGVAGRHVREYQIDHAHLVDRLTFVLRGKREFLLTCRWRAQDGPPTACDQLATSFSLR